jgi:pilus assembly protein CpaE
MAKDGQEAVELAVMRSPHVAIISNHVRGISPLQTCEMLNAVAPTVMPVLLVDSRSPENLESAMRSGVRAILSIPVEPKELLPLISTLAEVGKRRDTDEVRQLKDPSTHSRVIAVTAAKGGVGKSTIAVNLSVILARHAPSKVALVDCYMQFGDIATMFNVRPARTLAELDPICNDLDITMIEDYLTRHPSGVDILVSSMESLPLDAMSAECLENLIYVLKRKYRYIVLDVPPMLHGPTLSLLSHANTILVIANLFDVTTATDTKRFFRTVSESRIPRENLGVVLNRVSRANHIPAKDMENLFEGGILATIPNDNRLVSAVNEGVPITVSDGDSPFGRSMRVLASKVSGISGELTYGELALPGKKKRRTRFGG